MGENPKCLLYCGWVILLSLYLLDNGSYMEQEFGEVNGKCLIYHKIACSINVKKTKIEFGDGHCVLKCICQYLLNGRKPANRTFL